MKNDLVETIDLGWLRFLSFGLVCPPYAVLAGSNHLSISQTVDHRSWAFADFPHLAGLCRGSKENWHPISIWKNFSKRRWEANCSRPLRHVAHICSWDGITPVVTWRGDDG